MTRKSPRILSIETEALHALRKPPVGGGSCGSAVRVIEGKLRRIRRVESRIVRERIQRLLIPRERSAQHRLVDEIHSELERMVARCMAKVVAELILLLVPKRWEQRDRRGELIVAVGLEARDRQRRRTERERKREAQRGIPRLDQVQQAGVEHKCSQPRRTEGVGVAEDGVPVVIVRGQSRRGQSCLLHQRVVRNVTVFRGAEEPLRLRRLRPVESERADVVAKRDRHILRNGDGWYSRN